MTGSTLVIEPEAAEDYAVAAQWYESQAVQNLSDDFAIEIERSLQKIVLNPALYPIVHKPSSARRVLVKRFPFKILYVAGQNEIRVKAILHTSQEDGILKQRVKRS